MGNRTLGDDIEDAYLGSIGMYTGGEANRLALEERRRMERQQQAQLAPTTRTRARSGGQSANSSEGFEEFIGGLIGIALLVSIPYYGITELAIEWYWAVGIGCVVTGVTLRLLRGPFYFVLTWIKWLFYFSLVVGLMYLFFSRSGTENPNVEPVGSPAQRVELRAEP